MLRGASNAACLTKYLVQHLLIVKDTIANVTNSSYSSILEHISLYNDYQKRSVSLRSCVNHSGLYPRDLTGECLKLQAEPCCNGGH